MLFTKDFLYFDGASSAIALKFVESMRYPLCEQDLIVAKLNDDLFIEVGMVSGKEYTISVKTQFGPDDWRLKHEGIDAARASIFDKWCVLLGKKT